jgi:hypothetical protein
MGVSLIHTPETLLMLKPSRSLFRMVDVADKPQRKENDYYFITFDVAENHEGEMLSVRMLTNQKHESHMVFMLKETPVCTLSLVVKRLGVAGHTLYMDESYFQHESAVARMWRMQMFIVWAGLVLEPVRLLSVLEPMLLLGETSGKHNAGASAASEDFFLRLYRKRVFAAQKKR